MFQVFLAEDPVIESLVEFWPARTVQRSSSKAIWKA